MTRTLVTGAGGFTGRYVTELLAARGHEVHGLVHSTAAEAVPGAAETHLADLADFAATRRVVRQVRPDHVVHLAAIAFVAHGNVQEMYSSNVIGTRSLLEALADLPQVARSTLLASSANVYGNAHLGQLDETVSPAPANDYGVTKLAMEYVASLFRATLPLIVVRPFNYVGRGQSPDFVIAKIVDHARRRAERIELGNLDVERDFSDVRAVADTYCRLLDSEEAVGGTFNVCSGQHHSLRRIISLVEEISGHKLKVEINPAFVRKNEVHRLFGDNRLLESVIGPIHNPPLEDTLRWMLEP